MRHCSAWVKHLLFFSTGLLLGIASTCLFLGNLREDEDFLSRDREYSLDRRSQEERDIPSSNSCVCGDTADRLKRLAKLALYVRSLNMTASDDCGSRRVPTANPEDAQQMKNFLYPASKSPVLDYSQATRILHKYQPKTLSEEYVFKKQLFVAVLTQQAYLRTRAKALYDTWGKRADKLIFFVGEDCNISADLSYLPIVKLEGIPDQVYPPLTKTFAVMQYMYKYYTNQFNWFMRADDDMYLRVDKLKYLLAQVHPYERVYMGRAGTGRKDDLGRLYLLPYERYCMGGPGIIMSTTTMRDVGPHLTNCLEAVMHHSKSSYNDDDVELGRCISRKINIQCSSSAQSRTYFYTDYEGRSLNPVTLWTTPSFQSLISLHPVKDPNHMQAMHYFYEVLQLQRSYENVHKKIEHLNKLCHSLPSYATPPLSVSAGCNLKFHPHINSSATLSSVFHGTLLAPKHSIPFFLRPRDKFDIHPWLRFNNSALQEVHGIAPERSPSVTIKSELVPMFSKLKTYIQSEYAPKTVSIDQVMDGYMRYNPHYGREYVVTLKLELQAEPSKSEYRKYHLVRELNPVLSVANEPIVSSSTTINVILPLVNIGASFNEFLLTYSHIGLQYDKNKLHLVVVVFSETLAGKVKSYLRKFTSSNHPASVGVVTVEGSYSYVRGIHEGILSLHSKDSLVFIADVNLRFGPGFFRRCRLNSELGKRVYYPVAFKLYDINFNMYADGSIPPVSAEVGMWDHQYFSHLCIYKMDFEVVGGYKNKEHSLHLFKAISRSHLDIMQAPEPGLFRIWTTKRCRSLKPDKMKACLSLKRAGLFEQSEKADYLGELKEMKSTIL